MMNFFYHFNMEAADLLQNLSLDSESKTVPEPASRKHPSYTIWFWSYHLAEISHHSIELRQLFLNTNLQIIPNFIISKYIHNITKSSSYTNKRYLFHPSIKVHISGINIPITLPIITCTNSRYHIDFPEGIISYSINTFHLKS